MAAVYPWGAATRPSVALTGPVTALRRPNCAGVAPEPPWCPPARARRGGCRSAGSLELHRSGAGLTPPARYGEILLAYPATLGVRPWRTSRTA